VFIRLKRTAFEKSDLFLENRNVARDTDIIGRHIRKPQKVIRASRPDAGAALRVPPVLNVALAELTACGAQQMLPRQAGRPIEQGHDILKLVAETESASGLVEARTAP